MRCIYTLPHTLVVPIRTTGAVASYIRIAWAGREELIFIHGAMREARVWEISDRTGLESHAFFVYALYQTSTAATWGLQTAQYIHNHEQNNACTPREAEYREDTDAQGSHQPARTVSGVRLCEARRSTGRADNDCRAVFSIASPSGRAVKVAVLTAGDTEEIINDNLPKFLAEGADIIVCACRMEKEKRCWLACKGFADNNGYGLHIVSNISTWHDGRTNAERPLSGLYPFWDAYSAEALLLTVMHLVNESQEE